MAAFPASVAAYGKPGGGEWAAGDRLVLTDLGRTLRAIATDGPDVFYKGWIADRIAEDMKANGGLITKEDLAAYQAQRTAARARHVSRLRHHLDAAAQFRRRGADRDAQHSRAAEPEADQRPADRAGAARADRSDAPRVSRSRALPRRSGFRRDPGRRGSRRRATRKQAAASIDMLHASSSAELGKDLLGATPTAEPDDDHTFLGARSLRHGRRDHLHARRRLRLARRRQGRRVPAQQRDGRLQQEAGDDQLRPATSARRRTSSLRASGCSAR